MDAHKNNLEVHFLNRVTLSILIRLLLTPLLRKVPGVLDTFTSIFIIFISSQYTRLNEHTI